MAVRSSNGTHWNQFIIGGFFLQHWIVYSGNPFHRIFTIKHHFDNMEIYNAYLWIGWAKRNGKQGQMCIYLRDVTTKWISHMPQMSDRGCPTLKTPTNSCSRVKVVHLLLQNWATPDQVPGWSCKIVEWSNVWQYLDGSRAKVTSKSYAIKGGGTQVANLHMENPARDYSISRVDWILQFSYHGRIFDQWCRFWNPQHIDFCCVFSPLTWMG